MENREPIGPQLDAVVIDTAAEPAPVEPVVIDTVVEPDTVEEGQEPEIITMAARQEIFAIGDGILTLSLGEDGQISACVNEVCKNIGEGDELFNSLNDLFAQLRQ